ncbi:MAG TPA: HTTM domain-containing protein, partial [Chloroflexota bacterium]|nr:HTTM domain-containing protein [Chloroflexota bacterium]
MRLVTSTAAIPFRRADVLAPPTPAAPSLATDVEAGSRQHSWLLRLRHFWFGQTNLAPLALLRIIYGLLLIVWLLQLWPDLAAFFTDQGMMPRSQLAAFYPGLFTLLALVGQWWQVALFWAASLIVALMLLAGYRTRLACLLAFLAILSFENRNPLILDSSDYVFKVVPLWMMFTAAGDRFSIDAHLREARGERLTGYGPAFPIRVLEFQLAWIYLATGLEKWAGQTWRDGTAISYVFRLSSTFARPLAAPLAANPDLVRAFTWETLAVELAFLPLVFLAGPGRLLAVATSALLQLGILLTLNVGNFPFIM